MTELLGVMIGAALAYLFSQTQERQSARRRRISLATALLSELRTLEYALYRAYHDGEIALWGGRVPARFFDDLGENVLLFRPATVHIVLQFQGLLSRVNELWSACNQLEPQLITDRHHWRIRAAAGYALEIVAPVKESLLTEGGIGPEEPPVKRVSFPNLPPAPDPSFKWEIHTIDESDGPPPPERSK
ncbi:MAG TPA: hypothetical protein VEK77_08860 [Gemmatimonadales bacterium]|nr:hypothetical protein [Gemmatimonadales bacterium]